LDFSLDFGEGTAAGVLEAAGGRRTSSGQLQCSPPTSPITGSHIVLDLTPLPLNWDY